MHLWFSMVLQNTTIPTPPEIVNRLIIAPLGTIIGIVMLLIMIFLKQWEKEENHQGKKWIFP
jgi:hypothetical protein